MKSEIVEMSLMITLIENPKGGFTRYFVNFPSVISEGETKESTIKNLMDALETILSS